MQLTNIVIAALAATVAAERVPYKLARKSLSLVALAARQEPGYKPEQTFCGEGDSCAAACGEGYAQCASNDNLSHCYDKKGGEVCCGDDLGNACEKDFYCAQDSKGETWCCPDGMSTAECAAEYEVTGGLSSVVPSATNTANGARPTGGYGSGSDGYGSDSDGSGSGSDGSGSGSGSGSGYGSGSGSGSGSGGYGNGTTPGSAGSTGSSGIVHTDAGAIVAGSGAIAAVVAAVAAALL